MVRKKYHITPNKPGGWKIKRQGGSKASKLFDTKEKALEGGRKIAKSEQPSQLIIHKKDGTIQTEHTYKKDPYPPKG